MRLLLLFILMGSADLASAQGYVTIIIDPKHLAIVNENGAVRLASENMHNSMLSNIRKNIDDIHLNISAVALVQRLIHRSLTEVDQALKSGKAVVQLSRLINDIVSQSGKMLEIAKDQPLLILFAEGLARDLKERGMQLASEVSSFILKEGSSVLMDFQKRDQLLAKVILELKVMRALLYSMERAMQWAKTNGMLRSANPFKDFINKDRRKAEEILFYYYKIEK
ncbi:hypothetical protein [Sphingobacterium suaedae]|uniref:Plasmid transfer protein n=1 Tax=Sphingobacterium suaedae TaxID=1686402 RepID=A0ABW5KNC1_9SPHI